MYAVIRTGGKQYRVAPGDVIRVEKLASAEGNFNFEDILAVSSDEGKVSKPSGDAVVSARVLGEGRGDKILVFHYKKKKQYKKMQGHRQAFTALQITEIKVDGQSFKADESKLRQPAKPKAKAAEASEATETAVAAKPAKRAGAKKAAKKAAPKKAAAKKAAPKKKK